jgi:hypothetical protein
LATLLTALLPAALLSPTLLTPVLLTALLTALLASALLAAARPLLTTLLTIFLTISHCTSPFSLTIIKNLLPCNAT